MNSVAASGGEGHSWVPERGLAPRVASRAPWHDPAWTLRASAGTVATMPQQAEGESVGRAGDSAVRDGVFISYRRRDTSAAAGRLADHLKQRLGSDRVFIDTGNIEAGDEFPERIATGLARARVVLVLVGAWWLSATDEHHRRRIDDPRDWVRQEIATALQAAGVTVIPLLVDGGTLPPAAALPDPLAQLTVRHAMPLRHAEFNAHAEQLVERIGRLGVVARREPAAVMDVTPAMDPELAALEVTKKQRVIAGDDTSEIDEQILVRRRQLRDSADVGKGTRLGGRYELLQRVGSGGFATVWLAYDEQHQRRVAVKVLHAQYADDRSRRERFFRGAKRMAKLDHRGVVRVLNEQGRDGRRFYFVMEYVPGGDLQQRVRSGQSLRERTVPTLLALCEALQHAHDRKLIHRDVKPANVLLDDNGRPKLTDFDLVHAADTTGGTRTGALGTWLYAAPEALARGKSVDVRADIYSLSMIGVFLLYGDDLPMDALRDSKRFVDDLPGPAELKQVLARGCEWEAVRRFASMREFAVALRRSKVSSNAVLVEASAEEKVEADRPGLRTMLHEKTGIQLVFVPGGEFGMGSPESEAGREDDERLHRVAVSPFWLGQTVVTNAQYRRFLDDASVILRPDKPAYWDDARFNQPDQPVVGVSWEDARVYAAWAGAGLRLPTEAEWEHAARAGTRTAYCTGDGENDLAASGWYRGNSEHRLHVVGEKPANAWGLHDMHGNVWEWCSDWYGRYPDRSLRDPTGSQWGARRVLRGGSWILFARFARSAQRNAFEPGHRDDVIGFRLARSHVLEVGAEPSGSGAAGRR